jgi:hypothetical protein
MNGILEIIKTIESSSANVNPTQIYNEGWMTRLLVYYSIQEKIKLKEIDFSSINYWTSEALLSSPFLKVSTVREGYTHTDIALGDFTVDYEKKGQIIVNPQAKQFGVIEAKMKSPLSKGTANAPDYNQAIRNITCIAHNTKINCKTFFYVLLPESKLNKAGFDICHLNKEDEIKPEIMNRFLKHNTNNDVQLDCTDIVIKSLKCNVGNITYEEWIKLFTDIEINKTLNEFYGKCIKWNKL